MCSLRWAPVDIFFYLLTSFFAHIGGLLCLVYAKGKGKGVHTLQTPFAFAWGLRKVRDFCKVRAGARRQ